MDYWRALGRIEIENGVFNICQAFPSTVAKNGLEAVK